MEMGLKRFGRKEGDHENDSDGRNAFKICTARQERSEGLRGVNCKAGTYLNSLQG